MINLHKEEIAPKNSTANKTADSSGKSQAQVKQDFFRLQMKLKRKKEFVEGLNPDLGEKFGEHLSLLAECCRSAAENVANDISQAYGCLVRAMAAAEWIETNFPLREEVRTLQTQCIVHKEEADRYDSSTLSCVLYEEAEAFADAGNLAFAQGEFTEAGKLFQAAVSAYKEAAKEAKELQYQDHLEACRLAEKFQNWSTLAKEAKALHSLEAPEAEEFMKQAAEHAAELIIPLSAQVVLEMVRVEAGTFTMSRPDGENYSDEVPHSVTLTQDFYLGKFAVTQAQWKAVMGYNPSFFNGNNLPVEQVSWHDAIKFCEALNERNVAPENWCFTLPTETQWEYAAQGGKNSKGYKYSGSADIDAVAWYYDNSGKTTHVSGQKAPNELGVFDMSGNVQEWCLDDYQYSSSRAVPEFCRSADKSSIPRVYRGGCQDNGSGCCRVAYRSGIGPEVKANTRGFRLALVPASISKVME